MKNRLAVWALMAFVISLSACAIITPRPLRKPWQWDGVFRVMPNSVFEPVAKAKPASTSPAAVSSLPVAADHEELSLSGVWRYSPDKAEKGESEKWFAPELDDSSWKTMPVPSNFVIEDSSLAEFYKPIWFRTSFEFARLFPKQKPAA